MLTTWPPKITQCNITCKGLWTAAAAWHKWTLRCSKGSVKESGHCITSINIFYWSSFGRTEMATLFIKWLPYWDVWNGKMHLHFMTDINPHSAICNKWRTHNITIPHTWLACWRPQLPNDGSHNGVYLVLELQQPNCDMMYMFVYQYNYGQFNCNYWNIYM